MQKVNLNLEYWVNKIDKPCPTDLVAINDAFKEYYEKKNMSDNEKLILAEVLLASCIRFNDEERGDTINQVVAKFDRYFAVEPMFYATENQTFHVWRYSYTDYVKAIPKYWSERAIRSIYERLGVELDDEEVQKIYNSDSLYGAFFSLVKETLSNNAYFKVDCTESFKLFAQVSYFNMWHLFGKLGFEGMSPFDVFAGIGIVTPPSSQWKTVALSEGALNAIAEIKSRMRGRGYPSGLENSLLLTLEGL